MTRNDTNRRGVLPISSVSFFLVLAIQSLVFVASLQARPLKASCPTATSSVAQDVLDTLCALHPSQEGTIWEHSTGNSLDWSVSWDGPAWEGAAPVPACPETSWDDDWLYWRQVDCGTAITPRYQGRLEAQVTEPAPGLSFYFRSGCGAFGQGFWNLRLTKDGTETLLGGVGSPSQFFPCASWDDVFLTVPIPEAFEPPYSLALSWSGPGGVELVSSSRHVDPEWLVQTPPVEHWEAAALPSLARTCTQGCQLGNICHQDVQLCGCQVDSDCGAFGLCTAVRSSVTAVGENPKKMCVGHSRELYESLYDEIVATEGQLDISLKDLDEPRARAALVNGLLYLNDRHSVAPKGAFDAAGGRKADLRGRRRSRPGRGGFAPEMPHVRLLAGGTDEPSRLVKEIGSLIASAFEKRGNSWHIRVSVAAYRELTPRVSIGWNDTNLIVRDGQAARTGGHEVFDFESAYLGSDPTYGLSIRLEGPAVSSAQSFLDTMWDYMCYRELTSPQQDRGNIAFFSRPVQYPYGDREVACNHWPTPAPAPTPTGDVSVISVAATGVADALWLNRRWNRDQSATTALLAMIRASQASIKLIQPSWELNAGGIGVHDPKFASALAQAVARDVDVFFVLGGPQSIAPAPPPPVQFQRLREELKTRLLEEALPPGYVDADHLLCEKLHPYVFQNAGAADGRSHARFLMVDDQVAYVGSQGLHPGSLLFQDWLGYAEHGFIIDDLESVKQADDVYWRNVWIRAQPLGFQVCEDIAELDWVGVPTHTGCPATTYAALEDRFEVVQCEDFDPAAQGKVQAAVAPGDIVEAIQFTLEGFCGAFEFGHYWVNLFQNDRRFILHKSPSPQGYIAPCSSWNPSETVTVTIPEELEPPYVLEIWWSGMEYLRF